MPKVVKNGCKSEANNGSIVRAQRSGNFCVLKNSSIMKVNKTPTSSKRNFSETDISPNESNSKKTVTKDKHEQDCDTDPIAKLRAKIEGLTETLYLLKESNDNLTKKIDGIIISVGDNSASINEFKEQCEVFERKICCYVNAT